MPEEEAYSVNNLTATPNEDGSFTIHFGGDPKSVNHLPISKGWNYTVHFYQPRKEILDDAWKFPDVKPVKSKQIVNARYGAPPPVITGFRQSHGNLKVLIFFKPWKILCDLCEEFPFPFVYIRTIRG